MTASAHQHLDHHAQDRYSDNQPDHHHIAGVTPATALQHQRFGGQTGPSSSLEHRRVRVVGVKDHADRVQGGTGLGEVREVDSQLLACRIDALSVGERNRHAWAEVELRRGDR